MSRGRLLQSNKTAWAHSKDPKGKVMLLEREVFAMPFSLSTGPLTSLSAAITAFSTCYYNCKFAGEIFTHNVYGYIRTDIHV